MIKNKKFDEINSIEVIKNLNGLLPLLEGDILTNDGKGFSFYKDITTDSGTTKIQGTVSYDIIESNADKFNIFELKQQIKSDNNNLYKSMVIELTERLEQVLAKNEELVEDNRKMAERIQELNTKAAKLINALVDLDKSSELKITKNSAKKK